MKFLPAICLVIMSAATPALHADTAIPASEDVPAWLFPVDPAAGKPVPALDSVVELSIPNSQMKYTQAQLGNLFSATDWHPRDHEPMPEIVVHGRAPGVFACGYCHTPTGQGRPENAALAGLPASYIADQLKEMRSGVRTLIGPKAYRPPAFMLQLATHLTDDDIAQAADYFSKQKLAPRVDVLERSEIPRVINAAWIFRKAPEGGTEALGHRLIEIAPDFERHERRDDAMRYIAYVPPGSIARGKVIAATGADHVSQACGTCHGAGLKGSDLAPPIAGRSPTAIARQLLAFKLKTRSLQAAQMMQPVVANLQIDDVIALAAYVGSLPP
jgi:cytochrome c553